MEQKKPLQGLFELKETNFAYDTIKLEVRVGRRTKIVDLGKLVIPRAPFDISDKVSFEDGHPKFEDVNKAAKELLEDLQDDVYRGSKP